VNTNRRDGKPCNAIHDEMIRFTKVGLVPGTWTLAVSQFLHWYQVNDVGSEVELVFVYLLWVVVRVR